MAAMDINPDAKKLEEAFFAEENSRLLAQLRQKRDLEERRKALREVVQIQDEAYLDHLMELGIRPETVLALSLVPLMAVAWADGELDDRERAAVLKAAESKGVSPDSPGRQLLETWLSRAPDPKLFEAWERYMGSIWGTFTTEQRHEMRVNLVDWMTGVAEAAGGFLGLTSKISASERAVLDRVAALLPVD
jgi:uncharacterized tellurite resistance protein B-like protein